MAPRIVYVALADARGHLMRAQIIRTRLGEHGIAVEIVTTSAEGQRFLAAMGTPAHVLRAGPGLRFDGAHNLRRAATTASMLLYLGRSSHMRSDRAWLLEQARGATFVVSDSLHPALLFAPPSLRVVQVYGENILRATRQELATLGVFAGLGARLLERGLGRSFACVEHSLVAVSDDTAAIRLPPIIAVPRTLAERPRPVAYLNPHFTDARIARAIEGALGSELHGVAEGYAHRPAWRAYDSCLADRVARAPVFISGAGMGSVGMAVAFGVPTIVLLSDQPEQRANAAQVRELPNLRVVEVSDDLPVVLAEQLASLRLAPRVRPDPIVAATEIQTRWTETFLALVDRAHATPNDRTADDRMPPSPTHRARPRDEQPRGRSSGGLRTRIASTRARRAARAVVRADAST